MNDKGKRNGIITAVLAGILGVLVAVGIVAPELAGVALEVVQSLLEAAPFDTVRETTE